MNQPRRFAGCTNLQLLCQLDQHQTCLSGTCSHLHRVDSVYKPRCSIQCALLQLHHCLHDMPTHRRSIDRDSAECSRSEAALCSESERRGVTVTDSEPLGSASAHDPEFQMFIDKNGSHYNSSLFCRESLVSSHVPRLYHPR